LIPAQKLGDVPGLRWRQQPQSQGFASFLGKTFDESQASIDPRLVAAQHLSHIDLLQAIVMDESVNDPRFFKFIGFGGNAIEIEDGGLGIFLVDLEQSSLEGSDSFESASSPKTFEAIDEYQRSFELTVDDRSKLIVLGKGSSHQRIGLGLDDPIAIETQIKVG
jgi:hypothetical protein